ncbi:MAG: winged helix-turn-helix transcriptional regulator [Oligoflexia bacterium]|nr:winged helix-turn-helix transcriptional regulator [Oligoflexia bacterium]
MKDTYSKMMKHAQNVSTLLHLLSNPTRLMILCLLINKEMYAQEILEKLGSTKGNISQHIKLLLLHKLLKKRKDANKIYYSIYDNRIEKLIQLLKELFCKD